MPHILVTGFEPFGDVPHNPSAAVLRHLPARIGAVDIRRAVLPVDTRQAPEILATLWQEVGLLAYLGLGLALMRPTVTVERQGENRLDFDQPDNAGTVIHDQPVVAGGPSFLPARLPIDAILRAWAEAGIAAAPSDSAGHYLCNQTLYLALHQLPAQLQAGFIHLPADETLAHLSDPVPLVTQAQAVHLALLAMLAEIG